MERISEIAKKATTGSHTNIDRPFERIFSGTTGHKYKYIYVF